MHIRRLAVLGGIIVLTGAGCLGLTEEEVSDSQVEIPAETFLDESEEAMEEIEESSREAFMNLEHPGVLPAERIQDKQVRVVTNKGTIVFKLYPDTAPNTVSNFVYLAEQGYYDGIVWHRVVPDFVIQGGDPTGSGSGGPGYRFEDELGADAIPEDLSKRMEEDPNKSLYQQGVVAMANAGPDTNGSQFFIMLENIPSTAMPHLYNIFGEVTEGQDVVSQIREGDVMESVTVEDVNVTK